MSKKSVWAVIGAVTLAIIGWDIWLYFDGVEGNTITQVVRASGEFRIFIAAAMAWLFGHFFG